jgi:hypothetical protein
MSLQTDERLDIGGIAAVINSRLAAEARVAKAISFGWLCGGAAIACCLASLGLALALYGYSYMISVKPAAELTAKALVEALEKADLKTTVSGTMSLSPSSQLTLASGQTVKLAEGTTVKLDPNSSVRVAGDIKMPQPSNHQLQPNTMSGDRLPFTTYTIFRSVPYGAGRVETGWNFALSDTTRPRSQYCSYIQTIGQGTRVQDVIAVNGYPRRPSPLVKTSFDFDGALANCIWFSGA